VRIVRVGHQRPGDVVHPSPFTGPPRDVAGDAMIQQQPVGFPSPSGANTGADGAQGLTGRQGANLSCPSHVGVAC
jgi:hypothetical protein